MIAIGEYLAAAPPHTIAERGVDVPRGRDQEALHPAGERPGVLRLHEHVDVRPLQADVHDPEPLAHRRGDRGLAQRLVHPAPPQAPHRGHDPHHHMQRVVPLEGRPCLVPLPRPRSPRLSPGPAPLAATPEQLLLDMSLSRTLRRRHDSWVAMHARAVN
jgi:hypothetical protein